jgi:hypothetical protein
MAIIAKYSLNWNANDSAGSNNWVSTNVTWIDWKSNWAGSFNWTNSNINIPDSTAIRLTWNYSIRFWINRWNSTAVQRIINKDNANDFSWGYSMLLLLTSSNIECVHNNWTNKNWDTWYAPPIWIWTRICLTFDWTFRRLYVNWVLNNTIATSWNITWKSTNNLFFWTYWATTALWQYLNWILDEVILDNTALTAAEIKNDYLFYNWFI